MPPYSCHDKEEARYIDDTYAITLMMMATSFDI